VRKDGEQQFARWIQALSLSSTSYPEDLAPPKNVYLDAVGAETWHFDDYAKRASDPAVSALIPQFQGDFEAFWKSWNEHEGSPKTRDQPFRPANALDTPYLNLFLITHKAQPTSGTDRAWGWFGRRPM
jgi:hypothetical protein